MSGKCGEHALEHGCQKKECMGMFGKIFGHSFRKYLKKEAYIPPPGWKYQVNGGENVFMEFIESQRNVYHIRCKRCGLELI